MFLTSSQRNVPPMKVGQGSNDVHQPVHSARLGVRDRSGRPGRREGFASRASARPGQPPCDDRFDGSCRAAGSRQRTLLALVSRHAASAILLLGGITTNAAQAQSQDAAPVVLTSPGAGAANPLQPPRHLRNRDPQQRDQPTIPSLPDDLAVEVGAGLPRSAFGAVVDQTAPLSPSQIRELKRLGDAINRATAERPIAAPRPVSESVQLRFEPGRTPHVLRLAADTVSSVTFTDATGAPWPVAQVISGAKDRLDLATAEPGTSNWITVAPLVPYVSTNLSIHLVGAPAPVVMTVVSDQPEVDFRLDVSMLARGPNAKAAVLSTGFVESISAAMQSAIDGIAPAGATTLTVSSPDGVGAQAWLVGDRILLRTRGSVASPAPLRVGSTVDGSTRVYELPEVSEVLTTLNGTWSSITISGFPLPSVKNLQRAKEEAAR